MRIELVTFSLRVFRLLFDIDTLISLSLISSTTGDFFSMYAIHWLNFLEA